MPLTPKGKKVKAAMRKQYGKDKGERVFYATETKGSVRGLAKKRKPTKKIAKKTAKHRK
ncbi:hypothetical protein N9Q05_01540 [bacterium]|nr:hypothetical protein [bacterium]